MKPGSDSFAPSRCGRAARGARFLALFGGLLGMVACSSGRIADAEAPRPAQAVGAPLVGLQPGAWFDAGGSLTIVGAGRRLQLVLSAPISACSTVLQGEGDAEQLASRASLPFHSLAETCRDTHPAILLADEGETASPAELERSYHEVARCAESDLALTEGWRPDVLSARDPCPAALGSGWHLPTAKQLSGLGLNERKAVAGALFDTEVPGSFGSLLVYARDADGHLVLSTLSPNASEQVPPLVSKRADQPLFGVSLRCARETPPAAASPPAALPQAAQCLREQRKRREELRRPGAPVPPELQRLQAWIENVQRHPSLVEKEKSLAELDLLLASPTLERLASEEREEELLTARYAELAEAVDDPTASAVERSRRREEFAHLRRRLGSQIVQTAQGASSGRTQLKTVLARLQEVLSAPATSKKVPRSFYEPALARLRTLMAR
jgi:hypothetical protein